MMTEGWWYDDSVFVDGDSVAAGEVVSEVVVVTDWLWQHVP